MSMFDTSFSINRLVLDININFKRYPRNPLSCTCKSLSFLTGNQQFAEIAFEREHFSAES